jgi:hypothetical protein
MEAHMASITGTPGSGTLTGDDNKKVVTITR